MITLAYQVALDTGTADVVAQNTIYTLPKTLRIFNVTKRLNLVLNKFHSIKDCQDSLATGWTVRGSNLGKDDTFRNRPGRLWDPPSLQYDEYRVSLPGVKRPGSDVNHQPPSNAEVKERVELHFYSSLRAFMACSSVNFAFTFAS